MKRATSASLPLSEPSDPIVYWFAPGACAMLSADGSREVVIGGAVVGRFTRRERSIRNAMLLGMCESERLHLGQLCSAFGVTTEMLRDLRRVAREQGIEAALLRAPGGRDPGYTAAEQQRLYKLFDAGVGPKQACAELGGRLHQRTVERLRTRWLAARAQAATPTEAATPGETAPAPGVPQRQLDLALPLDEAAELPLTAESTFVAEGNDQEAAEVEAKADAPGEASAAEPAEPSTPVMREHRDDHLRNAPTAVRSAAHVQHLGTWVLVAMVARLGLFRRAVDIGKGRLAEGALRIALEAATVALAVGERCIEGVRRLATPSAGVLLRAQWAPSASWTRRILGSLSRELGGHRLHMEMAGECLRQARRVPDEPAVFYIDNHLRPYRGKEVIRRGWRMQAKQVVPGTTDYYVHDEDGRPVLRFAAADNSGLTEWLPGIAHTLREVLEAGESMVLAFDRAGAFPEHMALLRDERFSFVTYERRPYPKLASTAFTQQVHFSEDDETVRYTESRINLGKGRGRLRRIAMQVPDERQGVRQINLVASGALAAPTLIAIMRGRWAQENGLKHGVVRWGINQLDGRRTEPYPEDAIIPNPARRRLDRAVRFARLREGAARCKLAELRDGTASWLAAQRDLDEAQALRRELEAQRATVPARAPLSATELAGVLRAHRDEYKVTVDALRISCANAEAELAVRLAPFLRRPAEAKKVLATLFQSPGRVRAASDHIDVLLQPAGTTDERAAIRELLASLNRCKLVLPGDSAARPLYFTAQI